MGKRGGRGSRARSKERRARETRARKKALNDMYRGWAEKGVNQKSGRSYKKSKQKVHLRVRRVDSGNIGCLKSHEDNYSSLVRFKLLQLAGYKNQWSSRYNKEVSKYIRTRWNSLQEAWKELRIVPVRNDIPVAYNQKNWSVV